MRLRVGARTDTGRVRQLNEDVYAILPRQGLFLVCDGMGGAPAGEVASQIALSTIVQQLQRSAMPLETVTAAGEPGCLPRTRHLAAAVRRSNTVIYEQGQQDSSHARMGTTVVGAWITGNIASVAHVGDSRAYLWHSNRLDALTRDHSLVEAEVIAGLLERHESLQSPEQNVLLRVLGGAAAVDVELAEVPVRPGDYLLLCSDGLTRMVPESLLASAISELREPQLICDHLIDAANRNGGADNITVVVVQVMAGWWQRITGLWRQSPGEHSGKAPLAV